MRFILIFTALVAFFSVSVTSIKARPSLGRASRHESSRSVLLEAVNYLEKYGYLDIGNDIQHADDARLVVAIQRMQSFFRLPATGQPDRHTLEMMRQPRCGCPDVVDTSDAVVIDQGMMPQQYKNAGLGSTFRWFHTDLNYTFLNFPSGESALQPDDVRKTMRKAFKQWSDVTPLTFSEVTEPSHGADIKIQFGRRNHNPKEPRLRYFDGPGGDIAHAYLPNSNWGDLDGDIHFDDEDMFTSDGKEGTTFFLKGNRYFEVDNDNRVTSPRGGQSNLFSINFLGCRNL